jgi:hypothetical protein
MRMKMAYLTRCWLVAHRWEATTKRGDAPGHIEPAVSASWRSDLSYGAWSNRISNGMHTSS